MESDELHHERVSLRHGHGMFDGFWSHVPAAFPHRLCQSGPGCGRVKEADLVTGASLQECDVLVGQERVLQDRQAGADERHRQLTDAGHVLHHDSKHP